MIKQQPKALRLADRLDLYATADKHQKDIEQAAAELRRLHGLNAELLETLQFVISAHGEQLDSAFAQVHDVIAKATGGVA